MKFIVCLLILIPCLAFAQRGPNLCSHEEDFTLSYVQMFFDSFTKHGGTSFYKEMDKNLKKTIDRYCKGNQLDDLKFVMDLNGACLNSCDELAGKKYFKTSKKKYELVTTECALVCMSQKNYMLGLYNGIKI
jgi:hypothetical protein